MTTEDDARKARKAAIERYKIVAGLLGLLSMTLLIIGLISAIKYPDNGKFNPPYFIGGFTGGFLGLLQALLCSCIVVKGPNSQENESTKKELGCVMTGQYILSFFLVIGCFVGLFLAGIGGLSIFYDEVPYQGTIKGLSATILVGCILEMALGIFGFYVICAYGKYFGYHIVSNNRRAVIIIKQPNSIGTAQVMTNTSAFVLNDPYMFTAGGGFNNAGTTNANVQALQEQNRLLQEQLRLQQELNQQRNQPFGFEGQPAPPPSYGHYS